MPIVIVLILTAAATSVLSGVLGMAGGLVLMGVAVALLPVAAALSFHGTTQVVANGSRGAMLWRHVRWRIVAAHAAGSGLAYLLMRQIRFAPDAPLLLVALGLVPFVARVMPRSTWFDATKPPAALACGFVTTSLQLVAGVAGPLLDAFFVEAPMGRREIVATKATTQALSHALKVAYFAPMVARGALSWPLLIGAAVAALVGTRLGTLLLEKVSEAAFRTATRRMVLVLGAVYLAQGLWRMR